jgi:hypothetical protein
MTDQPLDAYKAAAYCFHRSLGQNKGTGFALWLGETPPDDDPQRIPFSGDVYQEITWEGVDSDGFQSAQLRIIKFQMTGEHPQLGTLVVSLDTSRPGGVALLKAQSAGQKYPVVHTTRLHVIATSSVLPGVLLQNRGAPLEFVAEPSPVWPPEDTVYELGVPVVFEDRENPGPPAATASAGSVSVSTVSRP